MKAKDVPFNLIYDSLICFKVLQRALAEANEVESEALFRLMADPETMEAAMKLMSRRNKSKL